MSTASGIQIIDIPQEIIQYILTYCRPLDVSSFTQTCRFFREVIYASDDNYVWRELLTSGWDDPRRSHSDSMVTPLHIDWKRDLQNRVRAQHIVNSKGPLNYEDLHFVIETFLDVVHASSQSLHHRGTSGPSNGLTWLSYLLRSSSVLYQTVNSDSPLAQRIAQLKVYFSLSDDGLRGEPDLSPLITTKQRNRSRHFTYDLRNYTSDRRWGPFRPNKKVNWIHLHHLMNVVWANVCELPGVWAVIRPPIGLETVRAFSAPATFTTDDWAGVQGRWKRYVCFMDYRDLFSFNFSSVLRGPRDMAFFNENPRFREATRLIELQLKVVPRGTLKYLDPGHVPETHFPHYPPIFFNGFSRAVHGNMSTVEGIVSMGEDGAVRYHFWEKVTLHDTAMQWSSQGAQIGKLGCAAGVVGVWTTTVHDEDDPVGPFWLWKIQDDDLGELFDWN